jgi:hypothetical protein
VIEPVFISYARATSRDEAEALHDALTEAGCGVFLDSTDIEAGDPIPLGVVDALLGAKLVVVFADATYFTRWYCLREFHLSLSSFDVLVRQGAPKPERSRALESIVIVRVSCSASLRHSEPPTGRAPMPPPPLSV